MQSTPSVTILIPTYNQARYLNRAIDSVLAQDYPNLEVIVGDDNSPDGTASVVAGYDDARLKYHRNEPNLGRVRNYHDLLYNYATCDWVINLDGDDFFIDTSFISVAMKITSSRNDLGILFFDRYELSEAEIDNFIPGESVTPDPVFFKGEDYLLSWPRKTGRIHHLTALYSRQMAMNVGFYTKSIISSDYESLFRLMLVGNVCYINKKIAVWRKHEDNASRNRTVAEKIDDLAQFESVAEFAVNRLHLRKDRFDRWLTRNLTRKLYTYTMSAARNRDWDDYAKIRAFYKSKYPASYYRLILDPLSWVKILFHTLKDYAK